MEYLSIRKAEFIKRPNRFVAHVHIDDKVEIVHVKNTGRCKEILQKGTGVILEKASNKNRKTRYSLIAAYKNDKLINIDSQVPNKVVFEALEQGKLSQFSDLTELKKEVTFGNSRFDIYFETADNKGFIEVKGVTLENEGKTMFPDAPTVRGTRHVREMIEAVKQGYLGYIFFLIQIPGVESFTPNQKMDPDFAQAISFASKNGVKLLAYDCHVTENMIKLGKRVPILLQ